MIHAAAIAWPPKNAAPRVQHRCVLLVALCAVTLLSGCKAIFPSNTRNWSPDQAVLPVAIPQGEKILVQNIRNCTYLAEDEYVVAHYDKAYDLRQLRSVDFIVVPFKSSPLLAHTMLSFGFADGDYLGVSVEIRKEVGEKYNPLKGSARQYELMYVVADERDLIRLRANIRKDDVYVYRAKATEEQARLLFLDVMGRVNQLHARPEFYDTLTNNCTTNIMLHINRLSPYRIPYTWQVLLPGAADQLAYDLGLLDTNLSFAETRERARVSDASIRFADATDYSQKIRR